MVDGVDKNGFIITKATSNVANQIKTITSDGTGWVDYVCSSTHSWSNVLFFNIPFCLRINVTNVSPKFVFFAQKSEGTGVYSDWYTSTGIYEFEVTSDKITTKKDGVVLGTKTGDFGTSALFKISMENNGAFSYKDLMSYPI